MAAEAPPAVSTEPKGLNPLRSVIDGIFPKDLGADNAEQVAQQNLQKLKSRTTRPIEPPAPAQARATPPESSQLKALENFANPKPGEPEVSTVKPGQEPAAPAAPDPTPQPEVKPEPAAPALSDNLPDPGFADNDLLAALQKKPEAKTEPASAAPTEQILKGEAEPVIAAPEEDLDAPISIPKKAEEMQQALIKTSKLLREKQKKIKELEAKGSIDSAALATEPLQQRIKTLEAERAQLLNTAAGTQLENHPEFQAKYVRPMQLAENFINETAAANENISSREIFNAAREPDRAKRHAAVRAACTDLHPSDALQVEQAVDAIHEIGQEREKIKGNASQIMANLQKQQQETMMAQQALVRAESVKAHDKVFQEFMANPVLTQFIAKDPALKPKIEAVLAAAKQAEIDTGWVQNHEVRARAIQMALAFPLMEKLYQNKLGEVLNELKTERSKRLNLQAPSGLSTSPRSYSAPPQSSAPQNGSNTVADIVHSTFASVRGK